MSQTDIATIQQGHIAVDYTSMFSDARIQMVRDTIAQGAPPDVFAAMIDIAKTRRLDPLAKQIICAKFGSTWQYVVTIDGYRSVAEQTGQYAGNDAPVFTWDDPRAKNSSGKEVPESCTVTVYKLISGQRYPFSATVYAEEYDAGRNNWLSMPKTMLAKVAESHALRKAFPAVLSGTYTHEEMDQASREVIDSGTGEIVRERQPAPRQIDQRPSAGTGGPAKATDRQLGMIRGKGRGLNLDAIAMDQLCEKVARTDFDGLTRQGASDVIERLTAMGNEPSKNPDDAVIEADYAEVEQGQMDIADEYELIGALHDERGRR